MAVSASFSSWMNLSGQLLLQEIKMPLVRISMLAGKSDAQKRKIADAAHRALVETISIPAQDRFQIITEHASTDLIYDPSYLNINRTDGIVVIQITMSTGRTLEVRKLLFKRLADLLHEEADIRREDVFVNLVETAKENWSFGNGIAQYAT
jgi:phenylpyruvate tautomerase PptA (4-oxalocrotonate tautomerase family)